MVIWQRKGLIPEDQPQRPLSSQDICGIFVANTAVWVGFTG